MRPTLGLLFALSVAAPATAEPPKPPTPEQLLIAERQFAVCGVYLASERGPVPFFYVNSNGLSAEQLAKLPDPPFAFGVSFPRNTTANFRAAFRKRANLTALILDGLDRDDVKLLPELREWTTVTDLNLRSPCLNAANLKQLTGFKHLRALTISSPLDDQNGLWEQALSLPSLERLTLAGVREEGVAVFKDCKKLRSLTLIQLADDRNDKPMWPKHVAGMPDLEELVIGSMVVPNAAVEQLAPLKKLRLLKLGAHPSDDEFPRADRIDEQLALYHKVGLLHAHPRFRAANGTRPTSLAEVTAVDLSKTDVTEAGLKLVALCQNLRKLNLAELHRLVGKMSALAGLTKLRELDLGSLDVSDDDLKALKGMTEMRSLKLNRLTDSVLRILREQNQLHTVPFATAADGKRPASAADVTAFGVAGAVNFSNPPLSDAGVKELVGLTNLRTLAFGQLTAAGVTTLEKLTQLEVLTFWPSDDAAVNALAKLTALRELTIGTGTLTAKGWASLGRLGKVRTLALGDTPVRPEHLKGLRGMTALTTLRLSRDQSLHDQLKVLVEIGLGHAPIQVTGKDGRRPTKADEVTGVAMRVINEELPADGFRPLLAFPNLTDLDIADCTGAVDAALKDLHGLKHLRRLSVNPSTVRAETIKALAEAVKLESLTTERGSLLNDKENRFVTQVAGIAGLRELRLRNVNVGDAGLASLAAMPGLQSLEIGGGNFTDVGLATLAAMPKLRSLAVGSGSYTKEGLMVLAKCKTIRHLTLGARFECDVAFKAWKDLPELETLVIVMCPVGGTAWRALAEYPALVRLGIPTPAEEDDGLAVLAKLKTLRALTLGGPVLRDNGKLAESLRPLTQLTELDVTRCGVSFGQYTKLVESLQYDLPKCRIAGR